MTLIDGPSPSDVASMSLPLSEDERHEYKSSRTADDELSQKISHAASAFWNSGGGTLVIGVDNTGVPDGGISRRVGRQARRDWLDGAVAKTEPIGRFRILELTETSAKGNIRADCGVYALQFEGAPTGPHMAFDKRYYIRAGALSLPAGHALVDAIYARRSLATPMLGHVVRERDFVELGVVCLSAAPAFNVSIKLTPAPSSAANLPQSPIPVISPDYPFFFWAGMRSQGSWNLPPVELELIYHSGSGTRIATTTAVDLNLSSAADTHSFRGVELHLSEIAQALRAMSR